MSALAIVMPTVDRTPGENYCVGTLRRLRAAGVGVSPVVRAIRIVDSGSPSTYLEQVHDAAWRLGADVETAGARRVATLNVARALEAGVETAAPWVCFLEDDVAVCALFAESVVRWLTDHRARRYRLYVLGARDTAIGAAVLRGARCWHYPVRKFHMTQGIVLRRGDAADIATYLRAHPVHVRHGVARTAYDLLLRKWHLERYPERLYALATAPSFIQHVGAQSVIRPDDQRRLTFPSWRGPTWSYRRRVA